MTPFDIGRVAIWGNSPENTIPYLPKLAVFGNAMLSDVFLPLDNENLTPVATLDSFRKIRAQTTQNAVLYLRPQLTASPHGRDALSYAQAVSDGITRVGGVGGVDLDIEVADSVLAQYVRDTVHHLRSDVLTPAGHGRPTMPLCIDIAPHKTFALPTDLINADANLYVRGQYYFGNMEGEAAIDKIWRELTSTGIDGNKISLWYAAANETKIRLPDGTFQWGRVLSLPGYYQGRFTEKLDRGGIFTVDLLNEFQVL